MGGGGAGLGKIGIPHICGMLARKKDVFTNGLLKKQLPLGSGMQLWSTRD